MTVVAPPGPMRVTRKTSTILGLLFLAVMVSWTLGFALTGKALHAPDYLGHLPANRNLIFFGALFELIDIAAITGIMAIMVPLIRRFREWMAVWYLCFRAFEIVLLLAGILCSFALLTAGNEMAVAPEGSLASLELTGDLLLALRERWVHLILPFFYGLAALAFYYFFLQTRLAPRFVSIIGIVAAVLVLIGIPLDFLEYRAGGYVGILGGLNELFLAGWLIVKGFDPAALTRFLGSQDPA
ncbi:MAG: DUF4386 domain-containing protein [Saprospiraceae bacterium]|nr:DUF4386 domain-containing protein [Saprospiraceae bacterium]